MLVILNPVSRGGAGRALRPEIERELAARGVACRVVLTTGPGAATSLARDAAAAGTDVVVAAGGDGTVHEVANGLLQAADAGLGQAALGLIPIGTGNDFVKVVPGTSTRRAAYDTLAHGRRYRYDAGRVNWGTEGEYFLNAMGTGIDVEVVRQILSRSRRTGQLVYIGGLLRALRRYRPVHIRVEAGGETMELRVMTIAVANGTCIGGLFRICPTALPNDGWLDLCVVAELGAARIPGMALRLFGGRHAGHPAVSFRQVRRATIRVRDQSPLFFQLDGELREPAGVRELEVTIEPSRLEVIAAGVPGGAIADLDR
jgi:YegS/Rv2252/BmrU family lipid kinase